MKEFTKFRIKKVLKNENMGNIGLCEIIPQTTDLGSVIEYKSEYGVFYTTKDRFRSYIKNKSIIIK